MSTLVTYESSSDEDEPLIQSTVDLFQNETPVSQAASQDKSIVRADVDGAPMVGPFIPPNDSQNYAGYEEFIMESGSTERDVIRYLTQASHPMTEMPPSPPSTPDASTTARFKHFLGLKAKGVHFNEDLARKSAFKNPALLQTLMDRTGLESNLAYHTSIPPDVFDPSSFPAAGYKEALLKSQQSIRTRDDVEKKKVIAAGKRSVEFTSGGVSGMSSTASSPGGLHKRRRQ